MKNQDDIKQILDNIEIQIQKLKMFLSDDIEFENSPDYSKVAETFAKERQGENERIIEGVFDGQKMIGPDGKQYSIPANYISKSKLVEGDILKLTIDSAGNFIYKQIGPVDRDRLVGLLLKTEDGEYVVKVDNVVFKVILASVTYFKGDEGDEAVILVPKGTSCQWAAVENIIKKK